MTDVIKSFKSRGQLHALGPDIPPTQHPTLALFHQQYDREIPKRTFVKVPMHKDTKRDCSRTQQTLSIRGLPRPMVCHII